VKIHLIKIWTNSVNNNNKSKPIQEPLAEIIKFCRSSGTAGGTRETPRTSKPCPEVQAGEDPGAGSP